MFLFGFQKVITFLYAVVTIMLPKKIIYEIDFVRTTNYIVIKIIFNFETLTSFYSEVF